MYLASLQYPVNLNRAKIAFPEALKNVWNLNTKSDLIQDPCALSHCTKSYNIFRWEHNILHTKLIHLRHTKTKKCWFLRPYESNGRSFNAVNRFQNLLDTTLLTWVNFGLCFKFKAVLVFDLSCSQNLEKLIFFVLVWIEILLIGIGRPVRKADMF